MRSDFHRLLMGAAEQEGVSVRLGVGISGLEQHPRGVRVSLSDGGTMQTELLVGADGLHLVGDALHATTPHMASGAAMGMEDAIVLADLVAQERDPAAALERFGALRFPRCRIVVDSSLQLGEWEKHPEAPGADPAALIASSMAALAQAYRVAGAAPRP